MRAVKIKIGRRSGALIAATSALALSLPGMSVADGHVASNPLAEALLAGDPSVDSGVDPQCSLPVSDRIGGWACPGQPASGVVANATVGNYIEGPASWHITDNYHATSGMNCEFGFFGDVYGTANFQGNYSLNGAQIRNHTWMSSNTTLIALDASGNLLFGPTSSEGYPIDSQYTEREYTGPVSPGTAWKPWGDSGFNTYDNQYVNHATRIAYIWSIPNHGAETWFMAMKSSISSDGNNDGIYTFSTAAKLYKKSWSCEYAGGF
jgi:hypothetical protein